MQFRGIERSGTAPDVLKIEEPNDLVDVDFLSIIFRRPAEKTKIITHSRREVTASDVILDACAFVALTHLCAIVVQNERDVGVMRRLDTQRAKNLDVFGRVRKMIFAADDMRNFHFEVVDYVNKMKDP